MAASLALPRTRLAWPGTRTFAAALLVLAGSVTMSCTQQPAAGDASAKDEPRPGDESSASDEETVRAVERQRLKLLVAGDAEAARPLHADDFQLVNPVGRALSRDQYMQALSSGYLDYVAWDPGPIEVRMAGPIAAIRYRSELQVTLQGQPRARLPHWHTDVYRKTGGRWQVVWSQATEIK